MMLRDGINVLRRGFAALPGVAEDWQRPATFLVV
jgi:hypothetical protein